jgi:hypothetical protein
VTFLVTEAATETTIDVRVNDISIHNINQAYPLVLSGDVQVTSAEQSLLFTSSGETTAQVITLEDNGKVLTVNISGVGYAY